MKLTLLLGAALVAIAGAIPADADQAISNAVREITEVVARDENIGAPPPPCLECENFYNECRKGCWDIISPCHQICSCKTHDHNNCGRDCGFSCSSASAQAVADGKTDTDVQSRDTPDVNDNNKVTTDVVPKVADLDARQVELCPYCSKHYNECRASCDDAFVPCHKVCACKTHDTLNGYCGQKCGWSCNSPAARAVGDGKTDTTAVQSRDTSDVDDNNKGTTDVVPEVADLDGAPVSICRWCKVLFDNCYKECPWYLGGTCHQVCSCKINDYNNHVCRDAKCGYSCNSPSAQAVADGNTDTPAVQSRKARKIPNDKLHPEGPQKCLDMMDNVFVPCVKPCVQSDPIGCINKCKPLLCNAPEFTSKTCTWPILCDPATSVESREETAAIAEPLIEKDVAAHVERDAADSHQDCENFYNQCIKECGWWSGCHVVCFCKTADHNNCKDYGYSCNSASADTDVAPAAAKPNTTQAAKRSDNEDTCSGCGYYYAICRNRCGYSQFCPKVCECKTHDHSNCAQCGYTCHPSKKVRKAIDFRDYVKAKKAADALDME